MVSDNFSYIDESFADIQILRYRLNGFERLSLKQKKLIFCLSEATLFGRDITFDQFGKYNLSIRKMLEIFFVNYMGDRTSAEFIAFETYLKQVWFSNGIYHHYGCEKLIPAFSRDYLHKLFQSTLKNNPYIPKGKTPEQYFQELAEVIFNPKILPKRVNKADGVDLVTTSACNFYQGVTQEEVENFYASKKDETDQTPPSFGLNTTVVKCNGKIVERPWKLDGLYGKAIQKIIFWLEKALNYVENEQQKQYIIDLISFYKSGDLHEFNTYCIRWVQEHEAQVDFINGFIEVYGDPLGLKGTWEGLVEYKDTEATQRTQIISNHAQWFEDHSPIDERFKKKNVKGVTANAICAAMLGGDEYPSTAIGINLPNADWIRAEYGSKSITIENITEAYDKASQYSGFREEFVIDNETLSLIKKYGDVCDKLHTDLHECLGHGSGQLLKNVSPDALKAYGNTIEEARADLFGLYYIADSELVRLGLLPNNEAYKAQYYSYMMNGMLTQLTRIKSGHQIEEAHMRNRALIAHWCYEQGLAKNVMELINRKGKHYLKINCYEALRKLIAQLLAEIQRIKSEGDFGAAHDLVEQYAVNIDTTIHKEILLRYEKLHLAPYKGFINPVLIPVKNDEGNIVDVKIDYSESYSHQMLRYGRDYGTL